MTDMHGLKPNVWPNTPYNVTAQIRGDIREIVQREIEQVTIGTIGAETPAGAQEKVDTSAASLTAAIAAAKAELQAADALLAPLVHTHDERYYLKAQVDSSLAGKAATSHIHDDRYYTESEVDTIISAIPGGGGGVSDHGALDGLADDDHTQYALADGSRGAFAPPLGADDNYVTDAEKAALHSHANKAALDQVSGINTGDQDLSIYVQTTDPRLSDARTPTAHQHLVADIDAGASLDGQVLTSDGAGGAAWETPATGGLPELPAELLLTGKQYRLSGVSDAGSSASPSPDVIGVLITAQSVLIPIKSLVVTITTQASADAFVEIGIYDGATRSLVASFGQFNLNGSPGVRVLTLATAITLPGIAVFAAKLRSTSANGGAFRAAYPPIPLHYAGDYWDGYGSPTRTMSASHAGTGALPATLPSVSGSGASVPVMTAILG